MFQPKTLIYFFDFFFKNGNTAKPKYFLVLGQIDNRTVIASLPTRTNQAPNFVSGHGCIDIEERCINCYAFAAKRSICDNGFAFDLPTYIYGSQVEDYEISILEDTYRIEGIDYEIYGTMKDDEFCAIIDCIQNSSATKRKIKKMLMSSKNGEA
ncbi:hypothetical protein [Taibaiella soli]|uniref:Uncharacterized protein n=1 Tax=Taibaiella soli TaxID=1649169 RepID=A0A2W2AKS0_9BACT|nr:hypothetical protein [Taibaiella soli]PZF72870.1 hypothetical protein DN068_10685 [Taibaiella soli]